MSFYAKLEAAAQRNNTLLCVGLDPTHEACPDRFLAFANTQSAESGTINSRICQALLAWNRSVIEATSDLVCCYKPNIAFYEALGQPGMDLLRATIAAIPEHVPVLLDAKRGDIGSTAAAYARACFEELGVDAVTLSPYLGRDSIAPFAAYPDKGLFVLCHTSNPAAGAFQKLTVTNGRFPHAQDPSVHARCQRSRQLVARRRPGRRRNLSPSTRRSPHRRTRRLAARPRNRRPGR